MAGSERRAELVQKVGSLGKRGFVVEFREFINRGNVVDLAVAFVMGAAFKTVVDSFAGNGSQPGVLGGFIGAIFGGEQPDFSQKFLTVNGSKIPFGALATSAINFFMVAVAMFLVVKVYNKFRSADDNQAADSGSATSEPTTNEILIEIRDELRRRSDSQ